ncbi:PrsW family intramembrane metalloprotease [Nocardiopsis sp. HNM0947]|uniref:PrsW family intramembrane metalloprotease n=1 Tax=Nocardiopsis coralli TaxID=2772213 RepID=A0ABR9PE18_9ACTN|nr:PrsW family intramembrane metalloprotease [Nocardiopsis coralli]MBE3002096.1 PrsW family intramembrane metalloprotease [Nocardiopsis coralli]
MSHAPHEPRKHTPGEPGTEEGQVPSQRGPDHEGVVPEDRTRETEPADRGQDDREPADHGPVGGESPGPVHIGRGDHEPGQRLPALAALVVLAAACAVGLVLLSTNMFGALRVYAAPAVLAFLLCALTYAVGFWIFRRIRPVRAPRLPVAVLATVWGLLAATGVAAYANTGMGGLWGQILGYEAAGAWGAALTAPINEEFLKLAGVVVIAVAFPHALRGPIDGFIFGALVGVGFEVTENFLYALHSISQSGALAPATSVTETTVIRVVLTGLGSHWAMSAIAGTAVGLLAAVAWRPGARRALAAVGLVLLAMLGHFFFDSPLLGEGLFGVAAKVAFVFLSAMAVYFTIRHTFRSRVKRSLSEQGKDLGMRRSDAKALASRRGRHKALASVARPERPEVRRRQERMVEEAEDRAARYAVN